MLSHVIPETEVSLVNNERKILQTVEIPDEWYKENSKEN